MVKKEEKKRKKGKGKGNDRKKCFVLRYRKQGVALCSINFEEENLVSPVDSSIETIDRNVQNWLLPTFLS